MSDNRITLDELEALFGRTMPAEAFALVANPASTATLAEIRSKLTEMAASMDPKTIAHRDLIARLWGWVEKHDLRFSEAVRIVDAAVAEWKAK